MRFVVEKPSSVTIYSRHRGPYQLLVCEYIPAFAQHRNWWSKQTYPRGIEVDQAAKALLEENARVESISVYSQSARYFVTTYTRKEFDAARQEKARGASPQTFRIRKRRREPE